MQKSLIDSIPMVGFPIWRGPMTTTAVALDRNLFSAYYSSMLYVSGSQPFPTRGPLDKFCLDSRTTQKMSTFSRENFWRLFKVIFPNFLSVCGPPNRISPIFPISLQGQGQKKHSNFHVQSSCDTIHEKAPSLSSQFCQKTAWKEVGSIFAQFFLIFPS